MIAPFTLFQVFDKSTLTGARPIPQLRPMRIDAIPGGAHLYCGLSHCEWETFRSKAINEGAGASKWLEALTACALR